MPEGPSIFIAKEEMTVFICKKVVEATGNAKNRYGENKRKGTY